VRRHPADFADDWLEAKSWLACGASALLLDLREPRAGAVAFLRQAANSPAPALPRLGPLEHLASTRARIDA